MQREWVRLLQLPSGPGAPVAPGTPHVGFGNTHTGSGSTCCPVIDSLAASGGPDLPAVALADAEGLTAQPRLGLGVDHLLPLAGDHHFIAS